jgi:hypothetical protein
MSTRPLPHPDPATAPYWVHARAHEFALPKCEACGQFHFYPRAACPFCGSQNIAWTKASGRATVYSMTVVHRAPSPAFEAMVPYVVATVALAEGPHLMTNIVNCAAGDVRIGQSVKVTFLDFPDDVSLPVFEPSAETVDRKE